VVLGLARGGVPVAREVARELGGGLEVLVVRKLGAPQYPEYAIGAVAEGGALYLRPGALAEVGIDEQALAVLVRRETAELARRVRAYRGDGPLPALEGRTAIVVDDGVATGATARAAARAVRQAGASRVILAAPVIAEASREDLLRDFDEVVAVSFPEPFGAVGAWYDRFDQVTDDEVRECLREARAAPPPGR
jgi:putative phosphoribosyl transferase